MQIWLKNELHEFLLFYVRLLCSINFRFGPFEIRQFKPNCSPFNAKAYQSKKKYQEPVSFYLSSDSFDSFLSQASNLVHSSLHLSTWSPRFTSRDLYECNYIVGLLPVELNVLFYFSLPMINGSNSKLSLLSLHNLYIYIILNFCVHIPSQSFSFVLLTISVTTSRAIVSLLFLLLSI